MGGWIKLHRSIMDSAMWESEPFSRSQAWIDMLMLANHKPGVIFRRGVKVEIPRGGIGKSIRTLAERWSWSHGKVERFFSFLLDEEMVKKVGTKKTSVDTCYCIVNYEKYQDCGDENRVEDGKKTGRRREEDGDGTRMEEGKNGRKEINNLPNSANRVEVVCSESKEREQLSEKPDPIPYSKIIDHLNAQCGCQFKPTSNATKRHIKARWAEGFRLPDFEAVIDHKRDEWAQDSRMCVYLRPETLFSTKFEGYLQAAKNGPPVGSKTAQGSGNGTRRQGTARQQYMQDVGNLLENTNEIANSGRPMRLGQAVEPLPGVGPQQPDIGKLGGRLGGPA